jgi:hypothetical protein
MRKILIPFLLILIFITTLSFKSHNPVNQNTQGLMLAFVTYNDYGNNLYIDNLTLGERREVDLSVSSIENISPGVSYLNSSEINDTITPVVNIVNLGSVILSDTAKVFLKISPSNYFDSVEVYNISPGFFESVTFPEVVLNFNVQYEFLVYTSHVLDANIFNDSLSQSSIIYPGVQRKVLFEEFTSMASISAANNNTGVLVFSQNNPDSLCVVKYHINSPLGIDSLYFEDSVSINSRFDYYNPLSIPMLWADGVIRTGFPYTDTSNLGIPYRQRLNDATPLSINVTEERIAGDSIKATVDINIISPMLEGDYKLRVFAVEKHISYEEPPGSNGETDFYDVFRGAFPDAEGISINPDKGNYQYVFTFQRKSNWIDSMIFTLAFIQNDLTKEVINSDIGRNIILPRTNSPLNFTQENLLLNQNSDTLQAFHAVLFEKVFPPAGWKIKNSDALITFQKYTGANGPTFSGESSMYMNFYSYNTRGQWDTIYTRTFNGVKSYDTLRFDYAYARYDSFHNDSLIVLASTDGGETFPHIIFRKGGDSLATRLQTTSNFIPTFSQWRTYVYPLSTVIEDQFSISNIPIEFELYQNYPNPFNPSTTIKFSIKNNSNVSLIVYDITGREISKLVNGFYTAGSHQVIFNAERLSSGIYFYVLKSGDISISKKMILLK